MTSKKKIFLTCHHFFPKQKKTAKRTQMLNGIQKEVEKAEKYVLSFRFFLKKKDCFFYRKKIKTLTGNVNGS